MSSILLCRQVTVISLTERRDLIFALNHKVAYFRKEKQKTPQSPKTDSLILRAGISKGIGVSNVVHGNSWYHKRQNKEKYEDSSPITFE